MLLTEYNEQHHIESEREIAKEEGLREGQEQEQRRFVHKGAAADL